MGAISMASTAGGALTSVSLVGGKAKSYDAPRGFYTARGGELFTSLSHSSLAQTIKPANQESPQVIVFFVDFFFFFFKSIFFFLFLL